MENAGKVFKHLRKMRGKYLSVDGEYVNQGYLRYTKSSPYERKVFKRIPECVKRIYAYMEKTQKGSWSILLLRQEI